MRTREFAIFVNFAEYEGNIQMALFSATALQKAPELREQRARSLARELEQSHLELMAGFKNHLPEKAHYVEESTISLTVIENAILTTIYRAVMPSPDSSLRFCEECIVYARRTLQAIIGAGERYADWGMEERIRFINW